MMRWVLCWYGRATVNRLAAGSIPASAAACVLGRAAEVPGFQPGEAGSIPAGHSFKASIPGSTLLVVLPVALNQESVGSIPTPGTSENNYCGVV